MPQIKSFKTYESYRDFANNLYSEHYFDGSMPHRANYVAGFGGDWYDQVGDYFNNILDFEGKTILDAGCACGAFCFEFLNHSAEYVIGVDISEFAIATAQTYLDSIAEKAVGAFDGKYKFLVSPLHKLPIEDNSVDIYFSTEVYEHIYPKASRKSIEEAARVLKPGGLLYLQLQAGENGAREDDDPGHINIQTMEYWDSLLSEYLVPRKDIDEALDSSATGFIKDYGWNHITYQKP